MLLAFARLAAGRGLDLSAGVVESRMTRVLASGHEFDPRFELRWQQDGETTEVWLDVRRADEDVSYRALMEEGAVTEIEMTGPQGTVRFPARGLGEEVPIGVGDLQIRDVLALWEALRAGDVRVAGEILGLGATRLLVYEAGLGGGESALVYVESVSRSLRTIRVFDADDRLVRVYGDFELVGEGLGRRLAGFTARSIVNDSHTRFRIGTVRLGRPDG
jgi:hypothetical protein